MEPAPIAARHRAMRTPTRRIAPVLFVLSVLIVTSVALAACGSGSPASPSPISIDTPDAAAAAVAARTPLFGGIGPRDAAVIGQATWWEATRAEAAKPPTNWRVVFRVGWGDCPAGCIDEHAWTYEVAFDGPVTFQSETGPALPPDVIEALRVAIRVTGVGGRVSAGPTCPVARPNDPTCDSRPVNGAVLVVKGANGVEVARVTTDASGQFRIGLQPGNYTLEPQSVEGLMGTAAPQAFAVGADTETFLDVGYDTGIR